MQRHLATWYDEKRPKRIRYWGKQEPLWKKKLQNKIKKLRGELSILMATKPVTKHLALKIRRIQRKYNIMDKDTRAKIAEHKANIKGFAAQIRNKEKKIQQKVINKQFAENPRKVYR